MVVRWLRLLHHTVGIDGTIRFAARTVEARPGRGSALGWESSQLVTTRSRIVNAIGVR